MASITLDAITADNVVNVAEGASASVAITGTVGGDVQVGDTVTVTVNGVDYTGLVQAGLTFSIAVPGSGLLADPDLTVDASVTTTDAAGNTTTATDNQVYTVDTAAPVASITLDAITADNVVNVAEGAGASVAITGTVGGDVQVGDTVTLTVERRRLHRPGAGWLDVQHRRGGQRAAGGSGPDGGCQRHHDRRGGQHRARRPTTSFTRSTRRRRWRASRSTPSRRTTSSTCGRVPAPAWRSPARWAATSQVGDTVTVTVNGVDYTGLVQAGLTFSIAVPGSGLLADPDLTVDASVTTTDAAGNTTTATDTQALHGRHGGAGGEHHARRHHGGQRRQHRGRCQRQRGDHRHGGRRRPGRRHGDRDGQRRRLHRRWCRLA